MPPPSSTLAASSSHALLASSFREKRGACETDDEGVFSIRPSDLVKGRRLKKAKSPPLSEALLTKQQSNGGGGGGPVFIPPKFESPSGGLIKPSEYLRSLRPDASSRRLRREAAAQVRNEDDDDDDDGQDEDEEAKYEEVVGGDDYYSEPVEPVGAHYSHGALLIKRLNTVLKDRIGAKRRNFRIFKAKHTENGK